MTWNARVLLAALAWAGLFLGSAVASETSVGQAIDKAATEIRPAIENSRCLRCHGDHEDKFTLRPDGTQQNIFIENSVLELSVHGKVACTGCHSDVVKLPHAKPLAKSISCVSCHKQEWDKVKDSPDPKHERLGLVMRQTEDYLHSAHAKPRGQDQSRVNASCYDCHDAHAIGAPGEAQRVLHRLKNPEVCGRCHVKEKTDYLASVHGKAITEKKDDKSAVCSDCHTMHAIGSPKNDPVKLAITQNCGDCHKEAQKTYLASYHGQVNRLGYTNTAKCFDCHGGHGIQKSDDPTSRLHADNRLKICETCHKNVTPGFASFQAHGNPQDPKKYPALYWANLFMQTLIISVMAFFWGHVLLWLYRELMDRRKGIGYVENLDQPETVYFRRYSATWRWIHLLFAVATMVLALTGTTLLFSHTDWAKTIVAFIGGPKAEAIIHRTAATIWISIFLVHLAIACVNIWRNRKTFKWFGYSSMLPNMKDVHDVLNMFRWFFGLGPRPEFDRWTYWQKFDYWAPFWGAAIIGVSGMVLFLPTLTASFLPGWVFNIATLVHAEEALLATVFLNTVHFFNVHFRPSRFPMSTTIFTGAIPLDEFKHDHRIEYERLKASGELEKHLVKRISRRVDMASTFAASVLIVAGLTLLTLVLIGRVTMP
ncbi:MAG: cytochrome C [Alphaproteobacteria bacterium]|nr:cytochrome C [Alphaproteobacteria bacterium]